MTERPNKVLESLDSGKWHFRKIGLWHTESGPGHTVGDFTVNLCGTGKTLQEAIEDYSRNLIEFAERTSRQYKLLMEITKREGNDGQALE